MDAAATLRPGRVAREGAVSGENLTTCSLVVRSVQSDEYLLIPPIKECIYLLPGVRGCVCFEVVNNKVVEFLIVEVVVYTTPV